MEKMETVGDKLIEETLFKKDKKYFVDSKLYTKIGNKIIFYKVKASQGSEK